MTISGFTSMVRSLGTIYKVRKKKSMMSELGVKSVKSGRLDLLLAILGVREFY